MNVTAPPRLPDLHPERRNTSPPVPRRPVRWVVLGVVLLLLVLGAARLHDLLPSLRNPFATDPVDRTGPVVLKALEDLSQYRAATGHFEVIIDVEKDARYLPSFVKGERTLFVAAGTVDAAVDFSRLGSKAISLSSDRRTVTLTLPHARLSESRVDPGRSYVFDRNRGLVDRVASMFSDSPTGERELYILAQQKLEAAAVESELRTRAERNTTDMLESMLQSLGFTSVAVAFR